MVTIDTLLEVKIAEEEDFLKVKETLTRIGIASRNDKKLYQSCHILHKRGRYFIVHFKELFALDGKQNNFNEEDVSRRNAIAALLHEWKLIQIVEPDRFQEPKAPISKIKVLSYKEKDGWELVSKYNIGKKKV